MDGRPRSWRFHRVAMTDTYDEFNAFERSMWEQRGGAYADRFEALTTLTIDALLDAAGVLEGTTVLDVGTGPGFVAAAAAARGATVAGIDVADTMVAIARARVPSGEFRRASAEALPQPDGAFDAVVGNFVLLHLGHPQRGAAEARRVLRSGGRAAFTVWDAPTVNRILGVFHEAVAGAGVEPPPDVPTGPPMFALGESAAFATLLRDAGFETVAIAPCTGVLRVDPAEWWDAMLRSTPRTGTLITRQSLAVQTEIRKRYDDLVAPYADGTEVALPVAAVLASGAAPTP